MGAVEKAEVKQEVRRAVRRAAPEIEALARAGYFAKGIVYGLIGVLAARAAFQARESAQNTDPRGALERVGEQPFGQVILGLLALGLAGYALWHMVRAVLDPEHHGRGPKAWAKRLGYAVSAGVHLSLAWFALGFALAGRSNGRGKSEEDWTAELLRTDAGPWVVAGAGVIILGLALSQFYIAYRASFLRRLHFDDLPEPAYRLLTRLGQVGIAARGVVFAIVGGFLLEAAWTDNPQRAGGIADALSLLESRPAGPWLLGVVALGLIAYGIFVIAQSRYRIIPVRQS